MHSLEMNKEGKRQLANLHVDLPGKMDIDDVCMCVWMVCVQHACKCGYCCCCRVTVSSLNQRNKPLFVQSTGVKQLTLKKDEVSNLLMLVHCLAH